MATNGKKIAWLAVTLGIAALVAFGVTSKDWINERWDLHRLEHGDDEERRAAAEKLGEMGSVRAIRPLLELAH